MAKETTLPINCSGKVDAIFKTIEDYPASKQLFLGTVSGWCTGVVATKIGKAVAICVGGGIIFIQVANQQGYIKFNWDKIQKSIDKASDKVEEVTTGKGPSTLDKIMSYAQQNVPAAAGFVGGFLIGMATA